MKTNPQNKTLLQMAATLAVAACACTASAQMQVYSEDFDTDHSADGTWIINVTTTGYNPADVYFDYSSVGIPPAPNSSGTTRGLKLQANLDPLVQAFPSGSSASPTGFSITENFEMRWDWWLNFNGPLNGGGAGSTQIGGAGFGTAAVSAQVPTQIDSVFIGASGDGTGTSADYRVYSPAFSASLQDASGVYAAGTVGSRNNTHEYYQSTFPPVAATPAQLALYSQQTGETQAGSAGMRWNDISLRKVGNIITYTINGLLIATIDVSTNGFLGGANIVFGQFDINAGASTDINATNLAFSLVDNIRITNFATVVSATATVPDASETGPTPGVFTLTRTSIGAPLTVNYTVGGTATPSDDYVALPGSITFDANASEASITITPIDDSVAEATETVILTIADSSEYQHSGSASVNIADNEPPQLTISSVASQMYERVNDFATFRITRLGDLNAAPFDFNLLFTGTAENGVDYYPDGQLPFNPGEQAQEIKVYPMEDTLYEGHETVTLNLAAAGGGEYTIGSPSSASITLVDATQPPETVLFADNFNADSSANWNIFSAANDGVPDYTATFAFDYSSQGIPPAPSGGGDTSGLFLTVNKDGTGSAAAVNLYPAGRNFSGNFALRFDMFLSVVLPNAVSTEHVLFGINHSGAKTNWFRNSPGGVPAGWTFDGVFYSVAADGAGLGDYVNYSSPTTVANNPTALSPGRVATTLTDVFKAPPWAISGAPANNLASFPSTPIWADVEVSQIGNIITLKINNSVIFSYENATPYENGNVMIGYNDAYDSIGIPSSYVVIDNLRVVSLAGLQISSGSYQDLGANVQFDFTLDLNDSPASFQIQSAATVAGPYTDAGATIVQVSPGTYRATVPKTGGVQFYRVRHQ
jgi:hypothetical protein